MVRPGPEAVTVLEPFGAFFQREFHKMVTLAQAVSGDDAAGEDIAAEALLQASQRWDKIGLYDRPGAWVRRVTINLASNRRRRVRIERGFLRRQRTDDTIVSPPTRDDELWAAVARLPPKQRAAIALRYLDDMSVPDISEVLRCSESTVNSHMHKARHSLARVLATSGERS